MSEIDWMTAGIRSRNWMFKVAGGTQSNLTDFPFQSYLAKQNDEFVCGATILTSLVVLTAAHCLSGRSPSDMKLVAGDWKRSTRDGREQIMEIAHLIPHEDWVEGHGEHDIGLVVLKRHLVFNSNVSAIAYPIMPKSYAGQGSISGWGKTLEANPHYEDTLRYAKLPILPVAECAKKWENEEIVISDNFICAYKPGTDACSGDSGGPLTGKRGDLRQVIGVIVIGPGCGSGSELPGVYINVSRYGTWIQLKILEAGKNPTKCPSDKFYCQAADTCTYKKWVCDGDNDCGSTAEDEKNCEICQKGKYRCARSNKCISASKWCNGVSDCPSGEDEADCSACPNNGHRCNRDKRCVPSWAKCNWHNDCDGGDDEASCPAKPLFTCNSGKKIPENWKCDTVRDCPGGEDENSSNCPYKCNKACRPYRNNAFNEDVSACCRNHGFVKGHCNVGDIAVCL